MIVVWKVGAELVLENELEKKYLLVSFSEEKRVNLFCIKIM